VITKGLGGKVVEAARLSITLDLAVPDCPVVLQKTRRETAQAPTACQATQSRTALRPKELLSHVPDRAAPPLRTHEARKLVLAQPPFLEGTFWSGMISLAFRIDESEFGAEALLLARAVITDWRIAKVIRLFQPPRENCCFLLKFEGKCRSQGFDKWGSRLTC
jgi:hypothetical protein